MKLNIYSYSSLFDNYLSDTEIYKNNKNNFVPIDEFQNGIILEDFDEETILAIVQNQIGNKVIENYDEESFVFEGGVYIEFDSKTIVSQCCGDISNIENWRTLLTATNTSFEELWIGHPSIYYKYDDTFIYLSDYLEPSATQELDVKFQFNKKEFLHLLNEKIKLYNNFKTKIFNTIDKSRFDKKEKLKEKLFKNI